jgi:hypothetical protein
MMVMEPDIPKQHDIKALCTPITVLARQAIEAISHAIDSQGSGFGYAVFLAAIGA